MSRKITKVTIDEMDASPYQGCPQMGDPVYLIHESDNRLALISDWCENNMIRKKKIYLSYHYEIFDCANNKKGIWISDVVDRQKFEDEWIID